MKIEITITVDECGTDIQFEHEDGFWSLVFDDIVTEYHSYNAENNIAFNVSLFEDEYSPKNIRELTKATKQFIKNTVKIRRKILENTDIPWFD